MTRYLAKRILGKDHNIVGYEVKYRVDSDLMPRGPYDILIADDIYKYRKAEKVLGEWVVVEDTSLKASVAFKETRKQSSIDRLDAIDWSSVTTVAKIKAIVRDLVESR